MHDASLVVKAEKGKKTRHLVLRRIKARSQERTWNAGIAVRKAIFITNARNPRKPTPRRANPKRSKTNQMAELTLPNLTQKARVHGH